MLVVVDMVGLERKYKNALLTNKHIWSHDPCDGIRVFQVIQSILNRFFIKKIVKFAEGVVHNYCVKILFPTQNKWKVKLLV